MPEEDNRRRRGRVLAGLAVAVAVPAIVAAALVWTRDVDAAAKEPVETISVGTVAVERTDLSTSRTLSGTLGYGTPRAVRAGREGVITGLPEAGATVGRGESLYQVNDEPVPLFIGAPPLYRTVTGVNMTGRDVAMIAKNLAALGYLIGDQPSAGQQVKQTYTEESKPARTAWVTVRDGEGVLTTALSAAIKRWQRDTGLPADGVIEVGDLAVLPGAVRIDSLTAQIGDPSTGDLMSVTQTTKVITVQAPVTQADALEPGGAVTLRMPDGTETPGEVGETSTAAQLPEGAPPGSVQQVSVTVTMTDPKAAGRFDSGTVEVRVAGETRKGVLAVPVTALLALREGGYAIQLVDGRLLAVATGMFSGGMVEVSGDGVTEGQLVVTTS